VRLKKIILSFAVCFFLFNGCKEENNPTAAQTKKSLSLYLLADTSITAKSVWSIRLDSLALASNPLVNQHDLESYNWSTHTFVLNPFIESLIGDLKTSAARPDGLPFVIAVNNERIYLGALWWNDSLTVPPIAYIDVTIPSPYKIKFDTASTMTDLRGDQRIHDVLKEWGILIE
jgi:hypothetical protein